MKSLVFSVLLTWSLAVPVWAGPVEDSIIRQLENQGFSQIEVRRTLLGRSRIVAQSASLYREIVVNPVTGEILRDFWRRLDGDRGGTSIVVPGATGPSTGNGDPSNNGDDDADGDDDDGDDDNGDDRGDDNGGDDGDDD
ncbi:MAG: hypothetical protein AB3N17_15315 [Tateyamaria sp.]